ncbi:gamma-butyrobetaine dioxygenase [Pyricularia oryzae]|nr:gamma-butyrobetaine dioxygenase [Pyricularia oryzae]KAI7926017.1 gamma-butyrobetaine dioxygenase [Pyricularia oryzae]
MRYLLLVHCSTFTPLYGRYESISSRLMQVQLIYSRQRPAGHVDPPTQEGFETERPELMDMLLKRLGEAEFTIWLVVSIDDSRKSGDRTSRPLPRASAHLQYPPASHAEKYTAMKPFDRRTNGPTGQKVMAFVMTADAGHFMKMIERPQELVHSIDSGYLHWLVLRG